LNIVVASPPLIHYSKHGRHQDENLYLNIVCHGKTGTELSFDKNNADLNDIPWNTANLPYARPYNLMRAVKYDNDRLINVVSDLDGEALKRLILKDLVTEIYVLNPENDLYINAEKLAYTIGYNDADVYYDDPITGNKTDSRDLFGFEIERQPTRVVEEYTAMFRQKAGDIVQFVDEFSSTVDTRKWLKDVSDANQHYMQNIEVIVYGEAERLIAVEQLTSYFPSSLIHGSPRITFKIADDNIPPNAKNLLIFRTKNALDNSYQPTQYGLVDKV